MTDNQRPAPVPPREERRWAAISATVFVVVALTVLMAMLLARTL